jgi:Zn2+/Cd2+-exporting ATPase
LTTGKPQVYKVIPAEGCTEADVVDLAAALAAYSEHPIGQAICQQAAHMLPTTGLSMTSVQAQPGRGITGLKGLTPVCVGKATFVHSRVQIVPADLLADTNQLEQDGKTVVWVAEAGEVLGLIAIADTI